MLSLYVGGLSTAHAGLGDSEDSVAKDAVSMHGVHTALTPGTRVHSHDLALTGTGTVAHEYADANGRVFAVTWRGRSLPNMSVLLSRYFKEYRSIKGQKARAHGRAPYHVSSPNLEVDMAGHFGSIRGRVYIPALVPAGTEINGLE
jgi:hypothetical protein